ncbi:hypothetical protein BC939DRAFT_162892 [Gamsiella multidivaricata]|uniref:uncharacterized protein n=1 Tax=Gamsiella multidivaricata TaxID=101098 RepID=UPI00221F739E|nr:uncharacterized protein BC939DRAFT_162892 [Gamsiella multidivaricata]KAI7823307.1 hypothetical protein BC939DRAFT_162892 [Gamsiella multidivaricata]
MTLDVTGLHPSQAFRLHTPPGSSIQADIVKVKARLDTNTGQHIVLWRDVLLYFKNAQCAMKAGEIVAFLTDDNFASLKPRRINHHPGVVLDVVVDSARKNTIDRAREKESLRQAVFTGPAAPSSAMGMPTKAIDLLRYTSSSYAAADEAESVTQQVTDLSIFDQTSSDKGPVVYLTEKAPQLTMSPQAYLNQYTLQLRDIQRGQNDIVAEVRKNRSLQEQMFLLQQQMDEKQVQMLQMQKQALDHLTIIQSRVQTVLTQTYELHEYPIPRLFIVLPKASRRRDKLLNPFSDQYRLYFLCECGSHTMSKGGNQDTK